MAPVAKCLTPTVARRLADLRVDADVQRRLDELGEKANFGTLTDPEREEHAELLDALEVMAILKAHAQLVLARNMGR
jgi:hypothetical protein